MTVCARLHLRLDDLPRQHRQGLLAILRQERLDQPGALELRRLRKALLAGAEIAEPVVALPVDAPAPAQGAGLRWRGRLIQAEKGR